MAQYQNYLIVIFEVSFHHYALIILSFIAKYFNQPINQQVLLVYLENRFILNCPNFCPYRTQSVLIDFDLFFVVWLAKVWEVFIILPIWDLFMVSPFTNLNWGSNLQELIY